MRILLIIAHPRPKSVVHLLATSAAEALAANQHELSIHDLYQEKFDPLVSNDEIVSGKLDHLISRHVTDLARSDGLVIVHPIWWGRPPAIIQGWVDRVFRPSVVYDSRYQSGLLRVKNALIVGSANQPVTQTTGRLVEAMWGEQLLHRCGVRNVVVRLYGRNKSEDASQYHGWSHEVYVLAQQTFPAESLS